MKLLIWGTGNNTKIFLNRFKSKLSEKIVGYVDSNTSIDEFNGKTVYHPTELKTVPYDLIIVCSVYSQEIFYTCVSIQLDMSKIIFLYNSYIDANYNKYEIISELLSSDFANDLYCKYRVTENMKINNNFCLHNFTCKNGPDAYANDYVRRRCFELCAQEVIENNVNGSVAEAGVFRGDFAQYINYAFPDKKLYLCDTFESFDKDEASNEIKKGYIDKDFISVFCNTSVDLVMSKMHYKENVIVKKGLFPNTMKDINDEFAFVSLDMDLENSILEGLRYFYPRLSKGGYIFIHDYNNVYHGVKNAVQRYQTESDCRLSTVPICDQGGTLIVTK